jgi:flagellin
VAGTTGITAEMDSSSNAGVILTHATGADIIIDGFTNTVDGDIDFAVLDADGASIAAALTLDNTTATADALAYGQLDFLSHKAFTVGTVEDADTEGFLRSTSNTASLTAVSAINLGTSSGAESAISVIDGAINKINQSRADLGAISNRLDSTISNLTNVATNVEGSMSNIRDADFSIETSKLTRAQILTQAATSMLAQANTSKQSILALLQG